jgi:modulator of FtsH protease
MDDRFNSQASIARLRGGDYAVERNRVLRNTYTLLAISLVPTVLGAFVGLRTGLAQWMMLNPGMGMLLFFGGAFGLMFAVQRNRNSGLGVAMLLGFTFFMGLMMAQMLSLVLGLENGANLIAMAFGGTAIIFASMASLATVVKRDLGGLSKFLFVGVVLLLIAGIANIWLQLPSLMIMFSVVAIGIFSAFMLVDVRRVLDGGETNYISATLAIYLDLYNVFVNLLALLSIFGGGGSRR